MSGPRQLTGEEQVPLRECLDALMVHAVHTGDLSPLAALVDWLIAEGISGRTRAQVLADQWYTSSLHEERLDRGMHLRFASQLIEGGWCSPQDLHIATAENLYVLGVRCGVLSARIWDFVADYHHLGRYSDHSLCLVHRQGDDGN